MDQELHKKQYCQSCGMPLRFDVEEYLGTNADQSRSNEYCYYCLKDGEYTVDIPMGQMVDIWVKYTGKYNEYSNTNYTPQELRILLNKRLPTLKRWQQKLATRDVHHQAINRIKNHIDHHLEKDIDMNELCQMANLSFFHLRRVFRNITGENVGGYIQRLRLEHIAHKLISTRLSIHEILKDTVYQTDASLAKAFKKHFGISMSEYRERFAHTVIPNENDTELSIPLQPEIKKLNVRKAICYPVGGNYRDKNLYSDAWKKIIHYKEEHLRKANTGKYVSISQDNPLITAQEQCRFHLGFFIYNEYKPHGEYTILNIPAGSYAIFRHIGNYVSLPELYRTIYEEWLPQSGYVQGTSLSFEVYQNTPRETDVSGLITDVYIPIEKQ